MSLATHSHIIFAVPVSFYSCGFDYASASVRYVIILHGNDLMNTRCTRTVCLHVELQKREHYNGTFHALLPAISNKASFS